jgi:SAM-dependent methyltransferase
MSAVPCPVCATPFEAEWLLLHRVAAAEPVATHLGPRCTVARTGRPAYDNDAGYRARVCSSDPTALVEGDDGTVTRAAPVLRQRLDDLGQALAVIDLEACRGRARVLHIGSGDGSVLAAARHRFRLHAVGLEPWRPWAQAARARGLDVHGNTLERWRGRRRFDIVVEHGLLAHLCDPVAHLRRIAARLQPGGVALLEVPNLLGSAGTANEVLSPQRPLTFTARALVTACKRAGLVPIFAVAQQRLVVLCRPAAVASHCVSPGPDAGDVAQSVWGNDLRLELKRALARSGATPSAITAASRVHARCTHTATRADLAIEIANACERDSALDAAAYWLSASLVDRRDPEVEAMLRHVDEVRQRISVLLHVPVRESYALAS